MRGGVFPSAGILDDNAVGLLGSRGSVGYEFACRGTTTLPMAFLIPQERLSPRATGQTFCTTTKYYSVTYVEFTLSSNTDAFFAFIANVFLGCDFAISDYLGGVFSVISPPWPALR